MYVAFTARRGIITDSLIGRYAFDFLRESMAEQGDNFHDRLVATLAQNDDEALTLLLAEARTADLAESFDLLKDEDRSRMMFALPPRTAAEIVAHLDEAVRGDVVEDMDARSLSELISELEPDDAADVLGGLSAEDMAKVLGRLDVRQSRKLRKLLAYGEETAGGIMTPDVVAVPETATVADAVEHIRHATHDADLHDVYIVDQDQKLVGVVPLRRLVTSAASTRLGHICDRDFVAVYVDEDQESVVQIIGKYDAMEAAVIDADGRLVGRITHDDLIDVAQDLYRMAGTDAAELETSSILHAARVRLTWLLPCMAGMLLSATVLGLSKTHFDLSLFGALAMFVPMIGAISGNSGIQTSTIIVRGFATGELISTKMLRALIREGRIALVMAPVCGVIAWGLVSCFLPIAQRFTLDPEHLISAPGRVALAVGTGMASAILVAATFAITLPFMFRRLGVDPAIASGPFVTTANDVVSVGMYMVVAILVAR
jgi:magnesium transporter